MKWIHEKEALIIAGGWNPNIILNHDWLKKYLFPEQKTFNVTLSFVKGVPDAPAVSSETIKITLRGVRLGFTPLKEDPALLEQIQDCAIKIADYLPHTPVTAFGVNFVYEAENSAMVEALKAYRASGQCLESLNGFGEIGEELHRYSLPIEKATLNLVIKVSMGGLITYDFNFAHSIDSLTGVKDILAETSIELYQKKSQQMVRALAPGL